MTPFRTDALRLGTIYGDGRGEQTRRQEGRVLIVADNPSARRTLHTEFYALGFDIGEARSVEEALALCHVVRYEALLLDSSGLAERGIGTCREICRMLPRAALFMLDANDDHERKIEALEAGADDYVTKPFHMRELTARLRSALRCIRACSDRDDEVISIGDVELDPARRLMLKAGKPVHVTAKEFDLLHYMMARAGLPIARSRLLEVIWGPEYADQLEYLRNFVRQLRKKVEDDPGSPKYLLTDCCIGYRFTNPAGLRER